MLTQEYSNYFYFCLRYFMMLMVIAFSYTLHPSSVNYINVSGLWGFAKINKNKKGQTWCFFNL